MGKSVVYVCFHVLRSYFASVANTPRGSQSVVTRVPKEKDILKENDTKEEATEAQGFGRLVILLLSTF